MSDSEHSRIAEDLGGYALGALPDADSDQVKRHLDECADCRAELDWMHAAIDTLPGSVPQFEPPPELRARVMATVRAEAELLHAAGAAADRPVSARRKPAGRFAWGLGSALVAGFATVVAVIVLATSGGETTRTVPAQVTASLRGHPSAALRISGTRAQLIVARLPAPPADHVDELWVVPAGGPPRPAGMFLVRTGSVALTVPVRRGDTILVSVEPRTGSAAPTSPPFIRASA